MSKAGVVILYYPDDTINDNILSYLPLLGKLYIIDNSEVSQKDRLSTTIINATNVVYLGDNINHGISESLNNACKMAIDDGFSFLLTMDQDSHFTPASIKAYFEKVDTFQEQSRVAMFGVQHYEPNTYEYSKSGFRNVHMLITSGSLLNLSCVEKVGWFDEKLFIDEVDSEYCFRAIRKGFEVILFEQILLSHHLGTTNNYRSLKSFTKTPRSLHSPVRIYYMVRNHLYVFDKYRIDFFPDLKYSRSALLNRIKNNLFYNKNRWRVIKYLIKAISDYRNKKMGKIDS